MQLPALRPLIMEWARFIGFGALMTPVSFGLYMALVHWTELGVMMSSLARAACMTPVIFYVSRYLTWRKTRHHRNFWSAFRRYVFSRPVTLILHQGILIGAVWVGVHYALAYWVAVSLTGVFNFFYGRKVAFGAVKYEDMPDA
jgi:putative flippase GtrA